VQATFEVQVLAPAGLTVLSNMPEANSTAGSSSSSSSTAGKGSRLVTFTPTPPMSTYLLSIVVGQLEAVQGMTDRCVCVCACLHVCVCVCVGVCVCGVAEGGGERQRMSLSECLQTALAVSS
jgi:hypothetical protein